MVVGSLCLCTVLTKLKPRVCVYARACERENVRKRSSENVCASSCTDTHIQYQYLLNHPCFLLSHRISSSSLTTHAHTHKHAHTNGNRTPLGSFWSFPSELKHNDVLPWNSTDAVRKPLAALTSARRSSWHTILWLRLQCLESENTERFLTVNDYLPSDV